MIQRTRVLYAALGGLLVSFGYHAGYAQDFTITTDADATVRILCRNDRDEAACLDPRGTDAFVRVHDQNQLETGYFHFDLSDLGAVSYSAVDAVVPRRSMPELIRRAHAIADQNGIEVVCFGHAGDGNIHIDFVRRDADDPAWEQGVVAAVSEVLDATIALKGSITGEHGVGLLRRDDMARQFDKETLDAMFALKHAWDPNGLLNPGKIWAQ